MPPVNNDVSRSLPSPPTPSNVSSSPRTQPWLRPALRPGSTPHGAWLAGSVQRPEPAQRVGSGAGFVDSPDAPLAAEDAVIGNILVDTVPKSGRAHLESHLLGLIFYRMRQGAFVLEDLREVATVDPASAGWTVDEMLGLILGRIADASSDVLAARNLCHVTASSAIRSAGQSASPSLQPCYEDSATGSILQPPSR